MDTFFRTLYEITQDKINKQYSLFRNTLLNSPPLTISLLLKIVQWTTFDRWPENWRGIKEKNSCLNMSVGTLRLYYLAQYYWSCCGAVRNSDIISKEQARNNRYIIKRSGIPKRNERSAYQTINQSLPFVAALVHWSKIQKKTSMRVSVRYSKIIATVTDDEEQFV